MSLCFILFFHSLVAHFFGPSLDNQLCTVGLPNPPTQGAFKPGSPLGCLYMGHYVGSSPNAAVIARLSSFLTHPTAADDGSGGGPTATACVSPHLSTDMMSGMDEPGTSQSPDTTAATAAVLPEVLCGPPLGVALYQVVGGTAELFTARWALQPGLTRCGPCRLLGSPGAPVRGSNLAVAAVQVLVGRVSPSSWVRGWATRLLVTFASLLNPL